MNGHGWKSIAAGIAIAGIVALWTGNARLASVETSMGFVTERVQNLATEVKENRRLLFLERDRRAANFGDRL